MFLYEDEKAPTQIYNNRMQVNKSELRISPKQVMPANSNNVRIVQKKENSVTYRPIIQRVRIKRSDLKSIIQKTLKKKIPKNIKAYMYAILCEITGLTEFKDSLDKFAQFAIEKEYIIKEDLDFIEASINSKTSSAPTGNNNPPLSDSSYIEDFLQEHMLQHQGGELNEKLEFVGGHLYQELKKNWSNKKTYFKIIPYAEYPPSNSRAWKGEIQIYDKSNDSLLHLKKDNSFFPVGMTMDHLIGEIKHGQPMIGSSDFKLVLPSGIHIVKRNGTFYPIADKQKTSNYTPDFDLNATPEIIYTVSNTKKVPPKKNKN